MPDDKTKPRSQNEQCINIQDDQELKNWSERFRVTPDRLRAAVWKVGVRAVDVRRS
jgi:hypothetical protein